MNEKKAVNSVFSKYLYGMHLETLDENLSVKYNYENEDSDGYSYNLGKRYKNRSDRMNDCMNLWLWDAYHKNRVLDLKKVNRCKDSRFCPNCKKFSLASAISNFSPHFHRLLRDGYYPYIMTLTIPNVTGAELRPTLESLNIAFKKFWIKMSYELTDEKHAGFTERLMRFEGALKFLEITYNKLTDTYHPHFHCIVFSKEYDKTIMDKHIEGTYSIKRKQVDLHSHMDMQIMRLWTMCYNNKRVSVKNYDDFVLKGEQAYMCDIRECDNEGIWEVLKYTFKDTDIINYKVFKTFFTALDGRRIRQGHGILYNLNCEDDNGDDDINIEDYLTEKENPVELVTQEIHQLITVYSEYQKISRFGNKSAFEKLDEHGL